MAEKIDLDKIKQTKEIKELVNFSILNIDKPSDWTSFDVVNYIRKLFSEFGFEVKKCGHLGTLDPNVTGVLPVVVGEACKIQEYFMHRDKVYIGKMKLHKEVKREKLETEMKRFLGKINQLPPVKSRVKRQIRQREVMKFELINYNEKEKIGSFIAEVEAGTYIRKLVSDLGEKLKVGAQMIELRRIKAGLFSDKDKEFTSIEKVKEALEEFKPEKSEEKLRKLLIPAEIVLKLITSIEVKPDFIGKLRNGSPIFEEMLVDKDKAMKVIEKKEAFCVISEDRIIEVAKFSDKFENKSILAKPECVLS